MLSSLWDGAYKTTFALLIEESSPCSRGSRFAISLSEWSFPYIKSVECVVK